MALPRRRLLFLVAAASTEALAEGLIELTLSSSLRAEHGRRAYAHSRKMLWPEVGAAYRQVIDRVASRGVARRQVPVPNDAVAAARA